MAVDCTQRHKWKSITISDPTHYPRHGTCLIVSVVSRSFMFKTCTEVEMLSSLWVFWCWITYMSNFFNIFL